MNKFLHYFWRTLFIIVVCYLLNNGISYFIIPSHFLSPSQLDASEDAMQKAKFFLYLFGIAQIIIALLMMRKKPKSDKIIIIILTIIHTTFYILVVVPRASAL